MEYQLTMYFRSIDDEENKLELRSDKAADLAKVWHTFNDLDNDDPPLLYGSWSYRRTDVDHEHYDGYWKPLDVTEIV